MPMTAPEHFGTEQDGSASHDYCVYCYKQGEFTFQGTMEEMIDKCVEYLDEFNQESGEKLTKEDAVAQMREFFPHLKRWAKA